MIALRSGLSFCAIDDLVLFLDAPADRYFAFNRPLSRQFLSVVEAIGSGLAVEPEMASAFMAHGVLIDQAPDSWPIPHSPRRPTIEWSVPARPSRSAPGHMMLALACILCARIKLRSRPFRSIVHDRHGPAHLTGTSDLPDRAIAAFLLSLRLWPSRLECLPASVALRTYLRCLGFRSALVLGVKLDPFEAHCWVQIGDRVVGDTIEHVGRFTPIRSVS